MIQKENSHQRPESAVAWTTNKKMNENNWKNFDLERVVEIIVQNGFRMVSLQFVDEYLPVSVDIYLFLQSVLPETVELYLIADSTWGTSIDDISANHVSTDLLVYFGSDLSSSSSIPVVIVLESKPLNLRMSFSSLSEISSTEKRPIALFYEPCYYWAAAKLSFLFDSSLTVAELPAQADLMNWSRVNSIKQNSSLLIGGLRVPSSIASEKDMIVVYIGNKNEQMENILLRLTGITFYHYNPVEELLQKYQGNQTRQLMERYGGIEKVRKAKIIGLLIGSMGYDSVLTNGIINRLEILIKTAGKYFYTFVMGRINEAKLCNFPEVRNFFFKIYLHYLKLFW
jgi:diphthamide biosynthesis protein 2